MPGTKTIIWRRWIWPGTVGAVILVSGVWAWNARTRALPVETARVWSAPLVAEWSAVGYVESRAAGVSPPAVGRILRVLVEEGDPVKGGQLLATLSSAG